MKFIKASLLVLLVASLTACDQENAIVDCFDASNPENTNWFEEYTSRYEQVNIPGTEYISVGIYKFQTVYLPASCCANCFWLPVVLNCRGEQIGVLGQRDGEIDPDDIKGLKIIWRSPNFQCGV